MFSSPVGAVSEAAESFVHAAGRVSLSASAVCLSYCLYWYLTPVGSVNALSSDERTIPVNAPVLSNVGLTESITVVTSISILIFNVISEPVATLFTSSASAAVVGVTVTFQLPGATERAVGIAPAPVTT